jgi:hypothetical protein
MTGDALPSSTSPQRSRQALAEIAALDDLFLQVR